VELAKTLINKTAMSLQTARLCWWNLDFFSLYANLFYKI